MYCKTLSAALYGMDALPVTVEADVSDGMPQFSMVGFVSSQVREAQERVRTALRNLGMSLPPQRITINLAPGDLRKEGSRFDLPIAAAVLLALGRIAPERIENSMIVGELHLDGGIAPVNGILPTVLLAREKGCTSCILPAGNYAEGAVVEGIRIVPVSSLPALLQYCAEGEVTLPETDPPKETAAGHRVDYADIQGQESAKRAALIAAAGFHNLLLSGPPGSGKSMTAQRLPTILPALTREESLEISKIYSVAGKLSGAQPLLTQRPFRAPHHTISRAALVGSGFHPRPGEITLAHRGVLFLDELPEMASGMVELLRQPLEERKITIGRAGGVYTYPASFLLVAAMNPCPCGYYPDRNRCTCTPREIQQYQSHVSQALLDRIDLRCEVPAASYEELTEKRGSPLSSGAMREQVLAAYRIQQERYRGTAIFFNSELQASELETYCPLTESARSLLEQVYERLGLSARGYHRILRVARTIADLEGASELDVPHISEALCFRCAEMARPDADGGARWNGKGGKA